MIDVPTRTKRGPVAPELDRLRCASDQRVLRWPLSVTLLVSAAFMRLAANVPVLAKEDGLVNLASLARVTCQPAAEGDSAALVADGDPGRALVFAVGTKGEGTVTLTFDAPRTLERVRVLQGERAYYSTTYRLLADKDGDREFETTLAEAKVGTPWGEWVEFSFPTVEVNAVRFQSVAGVSEGDRAHPVVREIEVQGHASAEDLREMMRMGKRPDKIVQLRSMRLDTPITRGGEAACVILTPEEGRYRQLGQEVAAAIAKKTGSAPPVTSSLADADPSKTSVVALGQMINNKLIESLYWNHYVFLDSLCPGREGSVVQTVHDPYPWTAGHNVVVVGGSTFEGVQRAAAEFARLLPESREATLPYTLKVSLPPPEQRATGYGLLSKEYSGVTIPAHNLTVEEAQALLEAQPSESLLSFQELALKYLVTGEEPYLRAAKRVLDVMGALYEKEPERHPTWPEETNSQYILAMWDAVEESPVFTDEDRLRFTNTFLRFLYSLMSCTSDYGNLEKNDTIIWNHTTFPLMGLYFGGRYFRRYYDCTYMDTFLNKAAGAFRGQEKSWKPQCDADGYLTLTIGHTMEYALAENRMFFFESGNIRKYADYLIGLCDNRGWAAGFGDSGVYASTAVPDAGVPYAFWYTKDPRYLGYLNAIHGGEWLNPYHQDVRPVLPQDLVGLKVYPLDRQVYDYTKTRPYYAEPSGPPNVTFEQSFDKIAFRANLDPMGQYFLLDGYSRGKHLHYDGNAILKLTDRGEDWLVDGDYLVRNTTEHNMVSIVRDGRSEKLVPECAALLHYTDLPVHSMTETMMKDYNGVDWRRDIFWRKGGWIVVMDRVAAVAAGNYTFDCVWKCFDRGSEELMDARRFRIVRGPFARKGTFGVTVAKAEGAMNGRAVAFVEPNAQWQCGVNLRAGDYHVTLVAKGVDTSADSFWLAMDAEEPIAFHLPVGQFGPSSSLPTKQAPTPQVRVAASGEHTLTLCLRELPGPMLDRIIIENLHDPQNRLEIEAEKAPPARKPPADRTRRFFIVNADGADQSVTRRLPVSMKYLFQRRSATLSTGQETAFQNLLYLDDIGEDKKYDLASLGTSTVLARVGEPTVMGAGDFESGGLAVRAALFCVSAQTVSLVDAVGLRVGGNRLSASQPVSLEMDLAKGTATIVASGPAEVRFSGLGSAVTLAAGTHTLALREMAGWGRAIRQALSSLDKRTGIAAAKSVPAAARTSLRELWRLDGAGASQQIRDFMATDVGGDGHVELLLCQGNNLCCYEGDGKEKWTFTMERLVRCVAVGDVDGDGVKEVMCGGDDEHLHILSPDGREKASHKMIERLIVGQGGTTLPYVNCLFIGDLNGDGKQEVVAGCTNSQISAFDGTLNRLWNHGGIYHGVRKVAVADLDGDGKREVLAADHYGSVAIISANGRSISRAYSELGDVAFDVGDINGDGRPELVNGSGTGTLTAFAYPVAPLWSFNNYGYAAREVLLLDVDGDGKAETLVASDTGYLYALDGAGRPKWQTDLHSPVLALARGKVLRGSNEGIAVGLRDGSVLVLNPQGAVVAGGRMGSPVKLLKCADLNTDGADELIAVDEENRCAVLKG